MNSKAVVTLLIIAVFWSISIIEVTAFLQSVNVQWWIQLAIVIAFYGFPVVYLFRKITRNHILSNRQIIGSFLVMLALPIFSYAFLGVQIPIYESSNLYKEFIVYSNQTAGSNFTISFWTQISFKAIGSFSAEKPIHVEIKVFDSNVTDLTNYINMVSFTGSSFVQKNDINVFTGSNNNVISSIGYLNLTETEKGKYNSKGDLIWHQSIESHSAWLPPNTQYFDQNYWQNIGRSKIDITSASDTLAFQSSNTMEKLTYVLVGFSVVMLQPVLEAIFPEKIVNNEKTVPKNCPYYNKNTEHHKS
jgi:hypothetical protein